VPSVIDFATGTARHSVNIPLHGVPLRNIMTDTLGMPAFVDNDANAAALAEAFDDDLRPIAQTLVMLTVGTGVGGGIVINGRIHRGATGAAAELGHLIIGADLRDGAPPAEQPPQPCVARGPGGRPRARPPRERARVRRRPRGRGQGEDRGPGRVATACGSWASAWESGSRTWCSRSSRSSS
jgi:glucokinase